MSAHSVKDAYDRIKESLATLMVDFQIPSITVSPIVEIFPYTEDLDREIERKPMVAAIEEEPVPKGKVFSAPGSDFDDEEIEDVAEEEEDDTDESELEDSFIEE